MLDTLKLGAAAALLAAGVFAYHWFGQVSVLYRTLGLIVVAVAGLGIAYTTTQGHRLWHFAQDSRTELRRVVWPTRTEAVQTTLIVLVIVFLVGIFLWLLDMFLRWGFGLVTGVGS